MLNDIQKAEAEAKDAVAKAEADADIMVKNAREEAANIIAKAETTVRELKASSMEEGTESGKREAEKAIASAEGEIKAQEGAADALIAKAADAVMKKIEKDL